MILHSIIASNNAVLAEFVGESTLSAEQTSQLVPVVRALLDDAWRSPPAEAASLAKHTALDNRLLFVHVRDLDRIYACIVTEDVGVSVFVCRCVANDHDFFVSDAHSFR